MPIGVYKRTKSYRRKMSKSLKGRKITWSDKISNSLKGHKVSKETRLKFKIISTGNKYGLRYKHTPEQIQKIKDKLTGRKLSKKTKDKMSASKIGKMPKNIMKEGKFMNIKRGYFDINGKQMFFRSKWEANYALYLNYLIKVGQIKQWEYEKEVFIFEKIKFGTRSYRPDFKILTNNNQVEYHEVKGWMTSKSKTQMKRMLKYYPKIKLVIVEGDSYSDIKNKVGKLLKFY